MTVAHKPAGSPGGTGGQFAPGQEAGGVPPTMPKGPVDASKIRAFAASPLSAAQRRDFTRDIRSAKYPTGAKECVAEADEVLDALTMHGPDRNIIAWGTDGGHMPRTQGQAFAVQQAARLQSAVRHQPKAVTTAIADRIDKGSPAEKRAYKLILDRAANVDAGDGRRRGVDRSHDAYNALEEYADSAISGQTYRTEEEMITRPGEGDASSDAAANLVGRMRKHGVRIAGE